MIWPETLPQILLLEGFAASPRDSVIRSQMEYGPAKVRRRTTSGPRPIQGNLILTVDQFATFRGFYEDDLLGGSLRFDWVEPETGDPVEMRFQEAPSWIRVEQFYNVSLSLEILP